MNRKYLEESIRPWFIFGESRDKTLVDISDGEGDVLERIPREQAKALIKERDALIEVIAELLVETEDTQADWDTLQTIVAIYNKERPVFVTSPRREVADPNMGLTRRVTPSIGQERRRG
jgi:hypothetical protein